MTYAMTLDNSWELMTEEEMYDVNGGISKTYYEYLSGGSAIAWITAMSVKAGVQFATAFAAMLGAVLAAPTVAGAITLAVVTAAKYTAACFSSAQAISGLFLYLEAGGFAVTGKALFGVPVTSRLA